MHQCKGCGRIVGKTKMCKNSKCKLHLKHIETEITNKRETELLKEIEKHKSVIDIQDKTYKINMRTIWVLLIAINLMTAYIFLAR